jgi:hypothetical protein
MAHTTPMHKRLALLRLLQDNPGNSAKAQQARIVLALQTLGNVTTPEMVRWLDCPRAGARISELRDEGHNIVTHRRVDATEAGELHRFALYTLKATEVTA